MPREKLIVASRLRKITKDLYALRLDPDVAAHLDVRVKDLLAEAAKRARANGRRTVRACDI